MNWYTIVKLKASNSQQLQYLEQDTSPITQCEVVQHSPPQCTSSQQLIRQFTTITSDTHQRAEASVDNAAAVAAAGMTASAADASLLHRYQDVTSEQHQPEAPSWGDVAASVGATKRQEKY